MKKIILLFSAIVMAGSMLAADVSVTEAFSKVANFTVGDATSAAKTLDGDLTSWNIRYGRKNGDAVGGTTETGMWLQGQTKYGYLEMNTATEGGIKRIAFNWGHTNGENGYTINLQMFLRGTSSWESNPDTVFTHVADANYYVDSVVYDLQCKKNMRIKFANKSVLTSTGEQPTKSKGRPIIGKITITPYLMYGTKEMTVSLLNGSFTNNTLIDQTDEANPVITYSSNKTSVATVNANTGEVSPVSAGDATITAKWGEVKVTYVVHVVDGQLVENFSSLGIVSSKITSETTWEGDVCDWKVNGVRRAIDDTIRINPRKQGIWSVVGAYMETADTIEGGIKHVTFSWKQWGSETGQTLKTTVTAGTKEESQEVAGGTVAAATYNTFDQEMEVKDGVKLRIANTSYVKEGSIASNKGRYVIENIQITPYLLYTKKSATAKITAGTYINESLLNNTGATPTYKSSNEEVATVNNGTVTLLSVGTTTITAKWEEVYTSYELEVLDNVTMVEFNANGGDGTFTEPISYGAALQEIELPTRANYAFNAYFLTNDGKNRFTVTNGSGVTKFQANLTVESVNYTDDKRNWIYQGDNLTLYAQWKKKRTITLYNQEATTAGTETVKIAYCANNESEKLDVIECPKKTGKTFLGYFTEENGEGLQLIDKDGKFLANVEGWTNGKLQWVLNKDTFLYANWETSKTTIVLMRKDGTDKGDTIVNTYGESMPAVTLPTRDGWRFNAYWMNEEASPNKNRLTVTDDEKTKWVANRTYSSVPYTDNDRHWIYEGETLTLYAQWKQERTITLDNQSATVAGTSSVVTANCINNSRQWLKDAITCPEKDGFMFMGYYTEAEGQGEKLIGKDGLFIAKVENYTDSNKCWIKDADVTLYALWRPSITLKENEDNSQEIADHDGDLMNACLIRTLAAGKYNSFCLPFDISKENLQKAFGEDAEITSLTTLDKDGGSSLSEDKKNLNVVMKEVEEMEAGMPYLITLSEEVVNPIFYDVTIKDVDDANYIESGDVTFYGITSPFMVPDDKTYLFVSNNKLNWNNAGVATKMNGLRAYFHVPGMVDPAQVTPRLVMRQPQTPTGVVNVNENVNENHKMIINGRLVISRDGKMYNALGVLF